MFKLFIRYAFIVVLSISATYANGNITFEDVLVGLDSRDSKIVQFECEFKITLPQNGNHILSPNNIYRYSDGKEYCFEENYFPDGHDLREIFAWDNNKLSTYNYSGKVGTIRMPVGDEFYRQAHPLAMLGWRIGGTRFNESLFGHFKRSVNHNINKVKYSGKNVYLITGEIEIEKDNPATMLMAWIDVERDFIPLKIELHYVASSEEIAVKKSLGLDNVSNLYRRIDNLKYEYSDEIRTWFPIFGEDTYFAGRVVFKNGYSQMDISGLPMEEQIKYVERLERIPLGLGKWRYEVLKKNMNPHFDDSDFNIDYPDGTIIYDEFSDTAYKAGDSTWDIQKAKSEHHLEINNINMQKCSERETSSVKSLPNNQIEGLSPNEVEAEGMNNTPYSYSLSIVISIIIILLLIMVGYIILSRVFGGDRS